MSDLHLAFHRLPEQLQDISWQLVGPIVLLLLAPLLALTVYDVLMRPAFQAPEACKRIGLEGKSYLDDECEDKTNGTPREDRNTSWRVKSLWSYPVKSCKGIELSKTAVTGLGMKYDRAFTFAVGSSSNGTLNGGISWKFFTQRQVPALATVRAEVWAPDLESPLYTADHPNVQSEGVLVIRWPRVTKIDMLLRRCLGQYSPLADAFVTIPFSPTPQQTKRNAYQSAQVTIWKDDPSAIQIASNVGKSQTSIWLNDLKSYLIYESRRQNPSYTENGKKRSGWSWDLDRPIALFRVNNQLPRQVYRNAPKKDSLGYQPITGFQDAYPLQLLNTASIRDVRARLPPGTPHLSVRNFRGNIIVEGGEAYDEDEWKMAQIGGERYYITNRTSRCLLPNVDQDSGKKHPHEPARTMAGFRRVDPGCPTHSCLGMHVVPGTDREIEIKVGDRIEVVERGEHLYIMQNAPP